jgi:hypothetical protein
MKKRNAILIFLIASSFFFIVIQAQTTQFLWTIQAGGKDLDRGKSVVTDSHDNVIVTGFFDNSASFGDTTINSEGSTDIFIAKYDRDGHFLWVRQAGGSEFDEGYSITTDRADNIVVIGYFHETATFSDTILTSEGYSDIFIAKYSQDGDLLWVKQIGGSKYDYGSDVAITGSNDIVVTGEFRNSVDFGDTTLTSMDNADVFVCRFNEHASLLWVKQAGGTGLDRGRGIAVDSNDNILVTGEFASSTMNFGDTILSNNGSDDIFIAKYSSSGNLIWIEQAGGSSTDEGWDIATDLNNDIIITGTFEDTIRFDKTSLISDGGFTSDIFIAKYSSNGQSLWVKRAGGTDDDAVKGIVIDQENNVIITGHFKNTASFGDVSLTGGDSGDLFIVQFDANGDLNWAFGAGGVDADYGRSITIDNSDNIIAVGNFGGVVSFGNTTLYCNGGDDIFITKFKSTGSFIYETSPLEINKIPNKYCLYQNYPNPFNSETTICFDVKERTDVILKIYDMLGHEILDLVDVKYDKGKYEIIFNAGLFTSGIYFFRIQMGDYSAVKKMMFLK